MTATSAAKSLSRACIVRSGCSSSLASLSAAHMRLIHTRKIHSTRPPASAAPLLLPAVQGSPPVFMGDFSSSLPKIQKPVESPLSNVPLVSLLRSLMIQHASSKPSLLKASVAVLSFLADTKSPLLSPDKNPVLKKLLRFFLYDMFCAGENGKEVSQTTAGLKKWGVQGVVLCWAREFVFKQGEQKQLQKRTQLERLGDESLGHEAIKAWGAGTLKSVEFASPGDIVALKLSGAGPAVLEALQSPKDGHDPLFMEYIHKICRLAKSKGVSLSVDAEQQRLQPGIDELTMSLSRKYNGTTPGSAVVKNTYQVYLKSVPAKLSKDLQTAAREGFCAGVKLVRGAYLTTEDRSVIWDTKEDTDSAYDGVAEGLMRRSWNAGGYLTGEGSFPEVDLVLATHNLQSVQKAMQIRKHQADVGEDRIKLVFAQLMGMADHVSAAAIRSGQEELERINRNAVASGSSAFAEEVDVPVVYKYLVWGSVGECMKYLVRRAEENGDAASRTRESRKVLWEEVRRRISV